MDVKQHSVRDSKSKFRVMLPHHVNKYIMINVSTRKKANNEAKIEHFTLFTFHTSFVSFQSV